MLEYAMFERLPAWSQVDTLTKQGTQLAQREHNEWTVSLYSLHNRFVELWAKNGLFVTSTFQPDASPLDIVEPYLEHVNVKHLLKY